MQLQHFEHNKICLGIKDIPCDAYHVAFKGFTVNFHIRLR